MASTRSPMIWIRSAEPSVWTADFSGIALKVSHRIGGGWTYEIRFANGREVVGEYPYATRVAAQAAAVRAAR